MLLEDKIFRGMCICFVGFILAITFPGCKDLSPGRHTYNLGDIVCVKIDNRKAIIIGRSGTLGYEEYLIKMPLPTKENDNVNVSSTNGLLFTSGTTNKELKLYKTLNIKAFEIQESH